MHQGDTGIPYREATAPSPVTVWRKTRKIGNRFHSHFGELHYGCQEDSDPPIPHVESHRWGGGYSHRLHIATQQPDCWHQCYNFMIHAAAKMSAKKACTNVPIKCDLCSETHLKYNIHQHLQERHASWERRGDYNKITILPEEEERLAIPENHVGNSAIAQLTHDVRHMNCLPTVHDLHDDSPQRPRNHTQSMQDLYRHLPWKHLFPVLINNTWTFFIEF